MIFGGGPLRGGIVLEDIVPFEHVLRKWTEKVKGHCFAAVKKK